MSLTDAGEKAVEHPVTDTGHSDASRQSPAMDTGLQALEIMDYATLQAEWRRLYRVEPPPRVARTLFMLGIGWKYQEQVKGGLRESTRRRLVELATVLQRDGDVTRSRMQRLKPGAKLIREWHGTSHTVVVLEEGFLWQGKTWRSLSVIARTITGMHWSGPRFFGVSTGEKTAEPESEEVAPA